jgi:pyruvate formate lyase activating enzyme
VLERIRQVVARGRLLTVGLLFVPGVGDGPDQVRGTLQWVRENAGVDTALWIRGMVPSRRMMRLSVTTPEFLAGVEAEARNLGFRYISVVDAKRGVIGPDEVPCPNCGRWVIRRLPDRRLERNVRDGRCASCGTAIRLWS